MTRLRKKVDLTSRKAKNTIKLISPICLPLQPTQVNEEGETKRGLDSQQVTVTGYVTSDPKTNGILHQINPQIQPKNYCDEKFTNNNFDIGDKQAIDAAIPRGFDSTLMCASGQVVKFDYQMHT